MELIFINEEIIITLNMYVFPIICHFHPMCAHCTKNAEVMFSCLEIVKYLVASCSLHTGKLLASDADFCHI
jgi:hypothetical protein